MRARHPRERQAQEDGGDSYWPYASTLFDFTKAGHAVPHPGFDVGHDIYAVTAYILAEATSSARTR